MTIVQSKNFVFISGASGSGTMAGAFTAGNGIVVLASDGFGIATNLSAGTMTVTVSGVALTLLASGSSANNGGGSISYGVYVGVAAASNAVAYANQTSSAGANLTVWEVTGIQVAAGALDGTVHSNSTFGAVNATGSFTPGTNNCTIFEQGYDASGGGLTASPTGYTMVGHVTVSSFDVDGGTLAQTTAAATNPSINSAGSNFIMACALKTAVVTYPAGYSTAFEGRLLANPVYRM